MTASRFGGDTAIGESKQMSRGPRRTGSVPIIEGIVSQHADEASFLWFQRNGLVVSAHHSVQHLTNHDNRISAHLDGLRVAAEDGWKGSGPTSEDPGTLFVGTVLALEAGDTERLNALLSLAEAVPALQPGLIAAFGWVSASFLQGTVKELLGARSSFRRRIGIACCVMHGVDPKQSLDAAVVDKDLMLRASALCGVGELGRTDLAGICDPDRVDHDACRFFAARSAVLLGNRGRPLDELMAIGLGPFANQTSARRLALQAMTVDTAHGILQHLAKESQHRRWLIEGSGVAGDPTYVPWLIGHMKDPQVARLAGEAFSLIAGTDFVALNLERARPVDFESGPTDDPADDNVDLDPDEGLPWPDIAKIEKWWAANQQRFQKGVRYFMGAAVTRKHSIDVLKNGYQRQRILAAHYLCLLEPGTPLFNTSAPAWRQQRLLAKMT